MAELGLTERGEGGAVFVNGDTAIEWRLPVNADGGLLSHAQAGNDGGISSIVDATRQLRGDQGERQVEKHDVAMVHNEYEILSSNCTMLLGRENIKKPDTIWRDGLGRLILVAGARNHRQPHFLLRTDV